jgi:hypothetical protein
MLRDLAGGARAAPAGGREQRVQPWPRLIRRWPTSRSHLQPASRLATDWQLVASASSTSPRVLLRHRPSFFEPWI